MQKIKQNIPSMRYPRLISKINSVRHYHARASLSCVSSPLAANINIPVRSSLTNLITPPPMCQQKSPIASITFNCYTQYFTFFQLSFPFIRLFTSLNQTSVYVYHTQCEAMKLRSLYWCYCYSAIVSSFNQ